MDDYELDTDSCCPQCGHEPIHYRRCAGLHCDDGWIDETEFDPNEGDPHVRCEECHGTGIERWCPGCGADLSLIVKQERHAEMLELLDDITRSLSRRHQRKQLTRRRVSYIVLPTGKQSRNPRCEYQACTQRGQEFYLPNDHPYHYCFEHASIGGFCWSCGQFWGGIDSFEMSITGLCEHCNAEILDDWPRDDDDDWDEHEYVWDWSS